MEECKPVDTPMEPGTKLHEDANGKSVDATLYRRLVGSLIYLTHTRPDICYSVGMCSRYMSTPKVSHWNAAKRILRYLQGTQSLGIHYTHIDMLQLTGYTDSSWADCQDSRRSTAGYFFTLGSAAITWSCKKQPNVTLSTTEAEYQAAVHASTEAIWLRRMLTEIGLHQESPTPIYCDNLSALKMTKNPIFHARTKHIEVHHHFIREHVQSGEIELLFRASEKQVADIFTKPLAQERLKRFRQMLGVEPNEFLIKGEC